MTEFLKQRSLYEMRISIDGTIRHRLAAKFNCYTATAGSIFALTMIDKLLLLRPATSSECISKLPIKSPPTGSSAHVHVLLFVLSKLWTTEFHPLCLFRSHEAVHRRINICPYTRNHLDFCRRTRFFNGYTWPDRVNKSC